MDTSVGNAARISRLPGTWNRKGEDTTDRPHRRAKVLSYPDTFMPVTKEMLAAIERVDILRRHDEKQRRRPDLVIDEDGVMELIDEFDEILHLGRVSDTGDATYFELLECPFAGRAHSGAGVGYGKTTIRLTPDSIGFCCFSDECSEQTFGSLKRLLHEKTGRWPSMEIWKKLTFKEQVERWGGVVDVSAPTEEEMIAGYERKIEQSQQSLPEWQFDSATLATMYSEEFRFDAAPPWPLGPWGLTEEEVRNLYYFEMMDQMAIAEKAEDYVTRTQLSMMLSTGKRSVQEAVEWLGAERMWLAVRDKERRSLFPELYPSPSAPVMESLDETTRAVLYGSVTAPPTPTDADTDVFFSYMRPK